MKYMVKNENGQQVLVPLQDGQSNGALALPPNRLPSLSPQHGLESSGDHLLVPGQVVEIMHDVTQMGMSLAQAVQGSVQQKIGCFYHEVIELIEED